MNRLILSALILFAAAFPAGAQNNSIYFPDPWSVHAMAESEGRMYAATNAGLFISDDEGGTWRHVPEMGMSIGIVAALDGKVIATDGTALYRLQTRDGKWERIDASNDVYLPNLRVVGNALMATVASFHWISNDGGLTFAMAPMTLSRTSIRSLGVGPQGRLFASGPDGHYLSGDSGASWEVQSHIGGHDPDWNFQSVFSSDGARVYFVSQDRDVWTSPGESIVFSNPIDGGMPVLGVIGKYLLVGRSGGMSRSSDNGGSFQPAGQGLGSGRTLELAAGSPSIFSRQTDGIYRSRDSGATWQKLFSGDALSRGLAVRGQEVFCIMNNRLYHSLNDGGNWTWEEHAAHPFVLGENALFGIASQLAFTSQGLVHKAVNGSVWFTRNRGQSWDSLWAGEEFNPVYALAVSGDRIYAALSIGIRESDDFGKTWKDPNTLSSPLGVQFLATRGREIFAAGTSNIHRSPDSGKTWVSMSQEGLDPEAQFTALALSGDTLYACMAGDPRSGLFFSVGPGSAWKPAPADPLLRNINALYALPGRLIAGQMRGPMFAYSLASRTWSDAGPVSAVQGFFARPGKLFAFSIGNGMYASADGGATWEPSRAGLATYDVLSLAALDGLQIGTARDGLFTRSPLPDWTRGAPRLPGQPIRYLASDGTNLYASSGAGEISRLPGGGEVRLNRLPAAVTYVNGLAADGQNLYAATNAGLFAASLPGPGPDFEWRLMKAGAIQAVAVRGPNLAVINRNTNSGGAHGMDLHLSRDAGATFPDSLRISYDHKEKMVVAFAAGGDVLIGGARGLQVRRNADGKMEKPVEGAPVHSIAVQAGTWAIGMHTGVSYTKDGVNWKSFDTAPAPTYAVAFSGDSLFAGGERGRLVAFHMGAASTGIDRGGESREAFPPAARVIGFHSPAGYSIRYTVPGECRLTLTLASLDGRFTRVFTGRRHPGGHHVADLPNGLRGPMRYFLEVTPIEGRAGRPKVQSGWLGSVKK